MQAVTTYKSVSTSFWDSLSHPIIGLSPMDGVTDAACRFICAKYGQPDVVFTEFTAVEGLRAGAIRLLEDFYYDESERPVVAQVFGADPAAFYIAGVLASALGFDGIDINMGCPAKNVAQRGAGAALIRDPERAKEIYRQTVAGTQAWAHGVELREIGVPPGLIEKIEQRFNGRALGERRELPVSIKTRIGYDMPVTEEWVTHLLELNPAALTIHGRTLKQLYTGLADWNEIAKAAALVRTYREQGGRTYVLGNGDIADIPDAKAKIAAHGLDGALIGRCSIGNPWIFAEHLPTPQERIAVALEHAEYLHSLFGDMGFLRIRRHLLEYTKGFPGAKLVRIQLSTIKTLADVERILSDPAILSETNEPTPSA